MDYVRVVITDTKGPFARGIKWRTISNWSHTALMMSNDTIQEATFNGGVHYASFKSLKNRSNSGIIVKWPVKDRYEVLKIAESLDKLPYDLKGALGLGFNRNWQENDSFWCSEANYYAIHMAGNEYYRAEALHEVTPNHLFLPNFEILGRF